MGKSVFETLSAIDVSHCVKVQQGNDYISWANAWAEVKKIYPKAFFITHEDSMGNPFFANDMGIFVKVTVHIEDEKQTHFFPVMNSSNKALKPDAYSYKVKDYGADKKPTGRMSDKYVEPANSYDINTAIMRGLTKCLALMGMALYIYKKEKLPTPTLLDSAELQEILDTIKEKGLKLSEVTSAWQIEKIAHLYSSNFKTMLNWIKEQ